MSQYSAQFLRGAVAALEDCEYSSFEAVMYQMAGYRALLAEAEAREAAPDAAAVIAQCKEALEELGPYIDAEDCRLAGSGDEDVKDTVIAHAQLLRNALAAIAAWEAGR